MTPKVSVIIPCYNRKQYIDECIRSVLASTIKDIEVILVDDGSSDETRGILEKADEAYDNVKVVKCEHKGPYEARWTGFSASSGEYVHFMDSDDIVTPDCYEVCYGLCKKENLDTIIFVPEVFNNEQHSDSEKETRDRLAAHFTMDPKCCNFVKPGVELFHDLMKAKSFSVAFQLRMFRRELLMKDFKKCPAIYHGDNYYSVVWLYLADRAMCIDKVLLKRRAHLDSITMTKGREKKHVSSMFSVILSLCQFAPFAEKCKENMSIEAQYIMRCFRGILKRIDGMGANAIFECISSCMSELDYSYSAFVKMCFVPMLVKWNNLSKKCA